MIPPVIAAHLQQLRSHFFSLRIYHRNFYLFTTSGVRPQIKLQPVSRSLLHRNSPVTGIQYLHFRIRRSQIQPQRMGSRPIQRSFRHDSRTYCSTSGIPHFPTVHCFICTPRNFKFIDRIIRITRFMFSHGKPISQACTGRQITILEAAVHHHFSI